MYRTGGWIAKAGSCKIGFKPKPSLTSTELTKNGLEARITNEEKHRNKKDWKTIVSFCIESSKVLLNAKNILYKLMISNHSNIDPSWLPHVPVILYNRGLEECEFWKTLKFEKSELMYANINVKNDKHIKKRLQ